MPEKTRVFMVEGMEVNPIVSNFEVTVEKLIYGGDGLARLDGRVVFTPYVLPGETFMARVEKEKPGLIRATAVEILAPSAERVPALCPYFSRCGGCHYQHANYEFQLASKKAIVIEELRRLGKIEPPDDIHMVAADPWGYRNRAQFHLSHGQMGYWESHSHKLCAIEQCPVSSPKLNQTITALNGMLHDSRWPRFVRSIEVFTDENQVQLNVLETDRPVARRFFDWCKEKIEGMVVGALDYQNRFRVGPNSFFQVNRHLLEQLVETAAAGTEGETALALYAGVGLFTIPLGKQFREVMAVETGAAAVRDLQFNVERAGLTNVKAAQRLVEEYLITLEQAPDFVLADPPRAGLGKNVVKRLSELKPRQITIVSCDPATLARDLSGLLAAGYWVAEMTLIDLFPQTYHVETVVRLMR